MQYRIEIYDTWGRRVGSFAESPLLEVTRSTPDQADAVAGILAAEAAAGPNEVAELGIGYRVRAFVEGELFCDVVVTSTAPQWSDARKLILDRYVRFHQVVAFEGRSDPDTGNTTVTRGYVNREIGGIVKDVLNSASGPIHYLVAHEAYPDGAEREYAKFLERKSVENELEVGGILVGDWVAANRINATGAYAKDGDTIAGLVVDGHAWPDLRMLMIDCEETARNSHAIVRHPEVACWTGEQYDLSGYKVRGDAAKAALQALIDAKGIGYIELNPHRDASGAYDDRVDAYGRYVGLVFGGGECFNAAMVETDHADVYLYQDGRYHVPEMALKEYYSYLGPHEDSVQVTDRTFVALDVEASAYEVLTALAYAAGGYVWSVDAEWAVTFRKVERPDRVAFFDPVPMGVTLGFDSDSLGNIVYFDGNPLLGALNKTYLRGASLDEYGVFAKRLEHFGISVEEDADNLCEGVLDDIAYPEPSGSIVFFDGLAGIRVGEIVELRGAPLRRLERETGGEWGGRFTGRLVGRVKQVTHRFSGRQVATEALLTSPLRSVENPLSLMMRSQPAKDSLYQFRLDDSGSGLDLGVHLD